MAASNRAASDALRAARAMRVRMRLKNSPAAFREKVSAMIRSGGTPAAMSVQNRVVRSCVFPDPAEARII